MYEIAYAHIVNSSDLRDFIQEYGSDEIDNSISTYEYLVPVYSTSLANRMIQENHPAASLLDSINLSAPEHYPPTGSELLRTKTENGDITVYFSKPIRGRIIFAEVLYSMRNIQGPVVMPYEVAKSQNTSIKYVFIFESDKIIYTESTILIK